jgi:hypothetical protein
VAADAASVVDDFRPLHTIRARCFVVDHVGLRLGNISETEG